MPKRSDKSLGSRYLFRDPANLAEGATNGERNPRDKAMSLNCLTSRMQRLSHLREAIVSAV
jgi:hypothetical protein